MTYGYDQGSRLTGLTYKLGSSTLGNLTYAYDALNRRTQVGGSFAQTNLPQPIASAAYDAANELIAWNEVPMSYDQNGNLTNDGVNSYTWDARNQLSAIGADNVVKYDGLGRRTENLAGTGFLYDGWNAVQELSGQR